MHYVEPYGSPPSHSKPTSSTTQDFRWRFCPDPKRGSLDRDWYTCSTRQFVAKLHCAYIDHHKTIPGLVYDATRTFPVHGNHPHQKGYQPLGGGPAGKVRRFSCIAHNLGVYPTGFAHVLNQLPRLVHLIQTIPVDCPIVLAKSPARPALVRVLQVRCLNR